jgi:hypothetical protein
MKNSTTKFGIVALVAILTVSTVLVALSQEVVAASANKSAFGDNTIVAIPDTNTFQTIASGTIKTSTPSDLLVRHDQECAIHTGLNLDTTNDDVTSAIREEVRLRVTDADGTNERFISPVPLGPEGTTDTDEDSTVSVTMCGRAYHIDTNVLDAILELCAIAEDTDPDTQTVTCDDSEPVFNSFIATKAAHGWSWVVPNLGQGDHIIEVQAKLFNDLDNISGKGGPKHEQKCNDGSLDCVDTMLSIGKKSLIITEEKFSSDI